MTSRRRRLMALLLLLGWSCKDPKPDTPQEDTGAKSPVAATPQQDSPEQIRARDLVTRAQGLAADLDYDAALKLFREAATLDPSNVKAARGLKLVKVDRAMAEAAAKKSKAALDLIFVGDRMGAWRELRDARSMDPNNRTTADRVADLALETRRYHETIEHYSEVLETEPHNLKAILNGALAAYRAHDWELCLKFLDDMNYIEPAAREDPKTKDSISEIWFMRGMAAAKSDRIPDAIASLERACKTRPDQPRYFFHLGSIYLEDGRFSLAEGALRRCLELDSNFGNAHYSLAIALQRQDQLRPAIGYFREALKRDKTLWMALVHIARCEENLGGREDLVSALTDLEEALRINPLSHEAMFTLQGVHKKLGNDEESRLWSGRFQRVKALATEQEEKLRSLLKAIQVNPKDIATRIEVINVHEQFHHVSDAQDAIRDLLNLDPKNLVGLQRMASLFWIDGKFEDAYLEAAKLIEYHPGDSSGYSLSALVLQARKQYPEALAMARKAFGINREDVTSLRIMLDAMQQIGGMDAEIRGLMPVYEQLDRKEKEEIKKLEAAEKARNEALMQGGR